MAGPVSLRQFVFVFFLMPLLGSATLAQVAVAAVPPPLADSASAMGLAAHQAIYDVRMTSAHNGSQVLDIRGKMYFEWKPSCEGWITDHRFSLMYDYSEAPALQIDSDFSTFEGFSQKDISFSSRRRKDGEVYEELRGKASLDKSDGSGAAVYTVPPGLTYDLGKGGLFPTSHTMGLLAAARRGDRFMRGTVFDGSDDAGPVEINSFIGRKVSSGLDKIDKEDLPKIDKSLVSVSGWTVRMAFFPLKNEESTSDYELTMTFLDNGVISDMKIDYADFSVSQKLVALKKIKVDGCTK